jgi:polyphenol oxidase
MQCSVTDGRGSTVDLYRKGDLAYLQSELINDSGLADHAFSTRPGGCSAGPLASLNTAFHTGDQTDNVLENRRRFFKLFGYDYREIVSAVQVHGTKMAVVDRSHRGEGALPAGSGLRCDALVTTERGLALAAYSADCMLIYFLSAQKPLAAIVHAGWRGTLGGAGAKLPAFLKERFNAEPEELLVALSPVICRSCYLVDHKIADQFRSAGWDDPACIEESDQGSWKLDLAEINSRQLLQAGIPEKNLTCSRWCTFCRPDLFYSYRRDKGVTGRMIGFIAIK